MDTKDPPVEKDAAQEVVGETTREKDKVASSNTTSVKTSSAKADAATEQGTGNPRQPASPARATKTPASSAKSMTKGKMRELKKRLDQKVNKRISNAEKSGILDLSSTYNFSFDFETIPAVVYSTFGVAKSVDNDGEKQEIHRTKQVDASTGRALKQLWLSKNLITTVSFEIQSLIHLTTLSLSHNHLSSIPAEIGSLHNLRRLFLDSNKLTGLPAHIVKLGNLEELRLDRNSFPMFPLEISMLRNLIRLGLSGNDIESVPGDIMYLTKLIELDLDENKLSSLPDSVSRLSPTLQVLGLALNHFSEIPKCVHELANLDILRLHGNRSADYEVVDKETGFVTEGKHIPVRHDGYLEYRSGHTIIGENGKEEHTVEMLEGYLEESIMQNRENADWLRREDDVELVQVLKSRAKKMEWKTENRLEQ